MGSGLAPVALLFCSGMLVSFIGFLVLFINRCLLIASFTSLTSLSSFHYFTRLAIFHSFAILSQTSAVSPDSIRIAFRVLGAELRSDSPQPVSCTS